MTFTMTCTVFWIVMKITAYDFNFVTFAYTFLHASIVFVKLNQIKTEYKKLMLFHHPDKGGDIHSYNHIQTAFEILSDENERIYYDKWRNSHLNIPYKIWRESFAKMVVA